MSITTIDPVVLFFLLGILASLARSGLSVPKDFYETLGIFLLLSIGIKGGVDLGHVELQDFLLPSIVAIILSIFITLLSYAILRSGKKLERADAVSIAAHYGSVSVVTFAVAEQFLESSGVSFEELSTVLLVVLEVSGIVAGIALSRITSRASGTSIFVLMQEVFLGKGVLLLIGGLFIGRFTTLSGNTQIHLFFLDLFKGFLALFMLEMGVMTAKRFGDLRFIGIKLLLFGIGMPIFAGCLGVIGGLAAGLSVGGTALFATMAASASYIAAPAAMRIAEPTSNPTLSMTAALGITFPFNILIGIPLYYHLTVFMSRII